MEPWVHLFSRFTTEALYLEVFSIFCLISSFLLYWIIRRRREGAYPTDEQIPSNVLKTYLADLIGEANEMRTQLFGLMHSQEQGLKRATASGMQMSAGAVMPAIGGNVDAAIATRLVTLESKLTEQTSSIQNLSDEKERLMKELEEARSAVAAGSGGAGSSGGGDNDELLKKLRELEARLAEYAVIEDDLANLKRLQQENAALKAQLQSASQGIAAAPMQAPQPVAIPQPVAAPAPTPPVDQEALKKAREMVGAAVDNGPNEVSAEPAKNGFDDLVNQVDQSLKKPDAQEPERSAAPSAPKSDEDLLAEFERMLNS